VPTFAAPGEKRNKAAHECKTLPYDECKKYVDCIKEGLKAWGVII